MMDRNDLEVAASLARIESKLNMALKGQEDHEDRIRKLETKGAWLAGASATVGALGGILYSIFGPKGH